MPDYLLIIIGIIAGYLLGAFPSGWVAARLTRGIDLRRYGTGGIGLSNTWHAVHSLRVVVPVALLDIVKVMPAVWWASFVGLDLAWLVVIGFCGIIGHNWPVYLGFHGGRGMLATVGFAFIVPVASGLVPWPLIGGLVVLFVTIAVIHNSAVAVFLAIATPQFISLGVGEPLPLLLAMVAIFLMMVFRRLVQPRAGIAAALPWRQILFYRFFFDRDIKDRELWVKRQPEAAASKPAGQERH